MASPHRFAIRPGGQNALGETHAEARLPTTDLDTTSLSQLVLAAGFVIGLGFGAALQLARFCTMGAIADVVVFGDATRLRMWVWAVLVAVLGTQALVGSGQRRPVGLDLHGPAHRLAVAGAWRARVRLRHGLGRGLPLARAGTALGRQPEGARGCCWSSASARRWRCAACSRGRAFEGLDGIALTLAGPQDLPSWLARTSRLAGRRLAPRRLPGAGRGAVGLAAALA
jgi:hypothetical protein